MVQTVLLRSELSPAFESNSAESGSTVGKVAYMNQDCLPMGILPIRLKHCWSVTSERWRQCGSREVSSVSELEGNEP